MRPRITISKSKAGELEIWVNETGRDLLVRELQGLSEKNDHFHFMPEDAEGEVPVRNRPYREGDEIIEWGKVMLRPDRWDAQYYPHVLDDATQET
jgi:hypothetical protein